jgi:hypothetical protein
MKACHKCKAAITVDHKSIGRKDACSFCRSDLRCCLNCRHHHLPTHTQCQEPQAEPVLDKERSNFCDFFMFREVSVGSQKNGDLKTIRKKLDDLFKSS